MHNNLKQKIIKKLRIQKNIYLLFSGYIYDFKRFYKYGGWKHNFSIRENRNYFVMLKYHGLEKSMSYKLRNPNSGWKNTDELIKILKKANAIGNIGYHDTAAKKVISKFLDLPENSKNPLSKEIKQDLNKLDKIHGTDENHGIVKLNIHEFKSGVLNNPELFFMSRYSLREFHPSKITDKDLTRALQLAMKTPSVCNRQHWHVYGSSSKNVIQTALKLQNGNSYFGKNIPNLFILAVDLRSFYMANERYQAWIDGGMYAMSLIYAFHSLGIGTCALNWSQSSSNDKKLRSLLNIDKNHTIITFLAAGYPEEENIVCSSIRKPVSDIFSELKVK